MSLAVVDISHFYITCVLSKQFSRRDLKQMAFFVLVPNRQKDIYKMSGRCLFKTSKTSCRRPKDVLNANLKDIFVRHLEETFARYIVDVLQKTSY